MSYTNELIDRYKVAIKVDSDYALAKALGLRPNRISNYRTGISHADDKTAVMLATVLHLDPMETIARINMDRATDKADKAFWQKFAGSTAVLMLLLGIGLHAEASPALAVAAAIPVDVDIMRNARRQLRKLLAWLASSLQPSQPCLAN
jgi:hypothetical protein